MKGVQNMKTTSEWALREILIAHRLPYFHWQVWAVILIFVIGIAIGVFIGIDQSEIIAEAIERGIR